MKEIKEEINPSRAMQFLSCFGSKNASDID
jgi:hypothetical protein